MIVKEFMGFYKGHDDKMYKAICSANHTETGEKFVVYKELKSKDVKCMPYDMFYGTVEVNGENVQRFVKQEWNEFKNK